MLFKIDYTYKVSGTCSIDAENQLEAREKLDREEYNDISGEVATMKQIEKIEIIETDD